MQDQVLVYTGFATWDLALAPAMFPPNLATWLANLQDALFQNIYKREDIRVQDLPSKCERGNAH